MFVHDGGLGSESTLKDGAEQLLLAFEMAEKSDFIDACFSSDLARGRALNTVPGEALGCGIQESFASLICRRRGQPLAQKPGNVTLHASTYLHQRQMQVVTCIFLATLIPPLMARVLLCYPFC